MRVSVEQGDPGYCLNHQHLKIFYRGTEITNVITADEEKRYIKRFVLDAEGRPIPDPSSNKCLTEVVYGDVRIEAPKGWFAWK